MTPTQIGIAGLIALFVLVALHVPLAFAMIAVGIVAFALQTSWGPALTFLATEPAQVLSSMDLTAVPLFLIMGAFVNVSGFSKDLYGAAAAVLGHRRGGLAYATIGGSAAFGAICGSSPATVATFTRVALPEMLARGYASSFSGATIAAGGAMKALIPPSLSMIIYCVVARAYIFDVFIAAVVPALITITANVMAITLLVRFTPSLAPVSERMPAAERRAALVRAAPAVLLIGTIFTGLYSGIFTVNEAASVAAVVSFAFAALRRTITVENFVTGMRDTAATAGMIYFILIGSSVFTYFISLPMIPEQLIKLVGEVELPPVGVIVLMLCVYLVLGSVFDELAAMIVTLPFALPIILHLGYDPVWWGIVNVIIVELGLIIPPIGLVILIINAMRPDIPLRRLYWTIMPFVIADMLVLALLTAFPDLALWLPALLKG
ncbi:TRAP transporter large permease [Rhodoplanes sp. TEM]|uniref:TRAP transporter large permease protein n=1 Tax=Rhodoplanes tepidamans TaxID=200616 RepID=A0ABT5J5U3_RHOTP|nr:MULTISPECIES: TRAP transporter large permease [Rhodoplanes]MDC7785022.1 TRAP transporter large permease [Rhodoplanes tepidamans]MDC7982496.1 TRAP transporter large permease [Rhodoplanes sp. TEM]MDQ0356510.1 tripartite ATP-independent transporter DctM subunit [Rhodoplanes tepidamans]